MTGVPAKERAGEIATGIEMIRSTSHALHDVSGAYRHGK